MSQSEIVVVVTEDARADDRQVKAIMQAAADAGLERSKWLPALGMITGNGPSAVVRNLRRIDGVASVEGGDLTVAIPEPGLRRG
ncbi:hypothetical protein EDC65_2009 [Stella humosa]|uniref:Uncharacterized protein n=1 Tax=Stella humosa TaxID=94 RepID=A0A3N1M955_9PROT|nr:hypothetical protein [Stella humosa]ROQ00213.1 hypothetical protein EDC65_2009 [Stella humosa]BBK30552.1 hypothetical protein STHU_11860 [Stella humosa]